MSPKYVICLLAICSTFYQSFVYWQFAPLFTSTVHSTNCLLTVRQIFTRRPVCSVCNQALKLLVKSLKKWLTGLVNNCRMHYMNIWRHEENMFKKESRIDCSPNSSPVVILAIAREATEAIAVHFRVSWVKGQQVAARVKSYPCLINIRFYRNNCRWQAKSWPLNDQKNIQIYHVLHMCQFESWLV